MKTSTIVLLVAVGLGAAYVVKKAAERKAAANAVTVAKAGARRARIGDGSELPGVRASALLDAAGQLVRPIGSKLSGRIGDPNVTAGLGESWSPEAESDGGMFGMNDAALQLMTINPYAKNKAVRMMPWWADRRTDQLNETTPADPYNLQAVNSQGNPVNANLQGPWTDGRPDRVTVTARDEVEEAGSPQEYIEPGDASYGNMTATDFTADESEAYDEDPGAMIGLRTG